MTEFSVAWCLSIVGQAAKAIYGVHGDGKELKRADLYTSNGLGRVVAMTTGMLPLQVDFFSPHRLHSNSNSSTVFCFTVLNLNSVSFSQSQC